MKLLKTYLLILLSAPLFLSAQNYALNTIGLRLGDSDGLGTEISYQKTQNRDNRMELNLGWRDSRAYDAFKISYLQQKVMALVPLWEGLNWYYGFGGGLGHVKFEPRPSPDNPNELEEVKGGIFVFGAGDLGIEYNFNFPLALSLDIRPEIGIIGYKEFSDKFDFDIGLGIRYQF